MEWMDGARRTGGLMWVAAGIVFGIVRVLLGDPMPGVVTLTVVAAVLVLAALVVRPAGRATVLAGRVVAVLLAVAFAGAVADRFGVWGPPGGAGVSWGSWAAFVDYTQVLLLGAPTPIAVGAAVAATAAEVALAAALLTGWQRRWTGKATAGLLTVYLVAMGLSVGWAEVARYAMPVEIGGALLVTVAVAERVEELVPCS
ncbi:hypothetical protein ACQEVB_29600 [Pseudonocardia sp. CA-107938]|uniref:hypothetical protein n=1 Tax=Pseudonocardia sp. CA-107938 TaxID=3240021 RepID=UPI003D9024F4